MTPPATSAAAPAVPPPSMPMHAGRAMTFTRMVIILGCGNAITPLAVDASLPALPSIGQALGADMSQAQLTISIFFFGLAIGQIFFGPLADRFGRRPALLAGIGLYVMASVVCALATSIEVLIAARLV